MVRGMKARFAVLWSLGWLGLACAGATEADPRPVAPPPPSPSAPPSAPRQERGKKAGRKAPAAAPAPAVDSPAFRTFETEDGKYRVVFTSETKVKKTWSNMSGPAVEGRWTQSADTVEVRYTPAEHHGSSAETFVTRGRCTLVRTARVDATTGERVESPLDYLLDDPTCD